MNPVRLILNNGANTMTVEAVAKEGFKFVEDGKKEDKNVLGHTLTIQIGNEVYEFADRTQVKLMNEILSTIQYDL